MRGLPVAETPRDAPPFPLIDVDPDETSVYQKNMPPLDRVFFLFAFALLTAVPTSQGALVFELDPTAQTFTFTGSDTGTPNFVPTSGTGRSSWAQTFPLADTSNTSLSISGAITADSGLSVFDTTTFRFQGTGGDAGFKIDIYTGDADLQTITGTGNPINYAELLSVKQKANLETFVNSAGTFPLTFGGGFSAITTQVVPEPSTIPLLIATLALFGATLLRRQRD